MMRGFRPARVVALATVDARLAGRGAAASRSEGPPAQVGQWGPVLNWPRAGQAHGRCCTPARSSCGPRASRPASGTRRRASSQPTPAPFGDMHCAAQVTLADGRVLVVGGQNDATHIGINVTSIFNPLTNTWSRGADMAYRRWYPTLTTMADGRALVVLGRRRHAARASTCPRSTTRRRTPGRRPRPRRPGPLPVHVPAARRPAVRGGHEARARRSSTPTTGDVVGRARRRRSAARPTRVRRDVRARQDPARRRRRPRHGPHAGHRHERPPRPRWQETARWPSRAGA